MGAHALAPDLHRGGDLLDRRARPARSPARGALTITSCAPRAGVRGEQVGVGARARGSPASGVERGVEVGHDPHRPARACPGAPPPGRTRVDLGRRAVLVALGERVGLGVDRRGRASARSPPPGRVGALAGDDRPLPGERVDAQLRHSVSVFSIRDVLDAGVHGRARRRVRSRRRGVERRARRSGRAATMPPAPAGARLGLGGARAARAAIPRAARARADREPAELRGRRRLDQQRGRCRPPRPSRRRPGGCASSSRPSSSSAERDALLVAEDRRGAARARRASSAARRAARRTASQPPARSGGCPRSSAGALG